MPNDSMRCVIVDDEEYAIELLLEQIEKIPFLKVVKTFSNPIEALSSLTRDDHVDILFLDIDMPQLSGIDVAARIKERVGQVIFITAYPQFAIKAFEVKASDYLLKPIDGLRFIDVVNHCYEKFRAPKMFSSPVENDVLFIKPGGKGKFATVILDDIILVQAEHNHIKIVTATAAYTTLESMKNITQYLQDDSRFIRIHKTYIINNTKILSIEGNTVKLLHDYQATISPQYRADFMVFIDNRIIGGPKL